MSRSMLIQTDKPKPTRMATTHHTFRTTACNASTTLYLPVAGGGARGWVDQGDGSDSPACSCRPEIERHHLARRSRIRLRGNIVGRVRNDNQNEASKKVRYGGWAWGVGVVLAGVLAVVGIVIVITGKVTHLCSVKGRWSVALMRDIL